MSFKYRQKAVLAKVETVEGTDAVPTPAADAILLRDVEINPVAGDEVRRENVKPYSGNDPSVLAGLHVTLSCNVELAGAGAAGTAPAYGPLLRGCGMAETINAAVDVQYDPVSSGEESLTLYFYHGSALHKILGTRGSWGLELPRRDYPRLSFNFTGLFDPPAAAALPDPDFSAFTNPLTVSFANTPTFDLHGASLVMESLSLAMNNQVAVRDLVNDEGIIITDRNPDGRTSFETPNIATVDFFAKSRDRATGALQIVHGVTAGNIVQVDCPKIEIRGVSYAESDGVSMVNADLTLLPNAAAGDDEIRLTVK